MIFMSLLTSLVRSRKGAFSNSEDVAAFYKGKNQDKKPILNDPDVERIRRNHLNDMENIPPFVLIGFLYVLTSPSPEIALWHFRIFAFSRILHTVSYQLALQPWRGLCFGIGLVITISMGWQVIQAVW
ncbi:hypothetical protein LSH36_501g01141 [Paralvinella palmiformis]|uniref:Microsomal glutathione S-transferase 1 n=1 Tax=Paralvinella palmiformis TaxID=53620 RepID=A0AAD9MXZ4_9ANNE|nr:hypothetical protein LSH36_501g01141 [Paralvinella palmiformis]